MTDTEFEATIADMSDDQIREVEKVLMAKLDPPTREKIRRQRDLDGRLTKAESMIAAMGLKMRPDGLIPRGDAGPQRSAPLLSADQKFDQWLRGPLGQRSTLSLSLPFSMKATILDVGGIAHPPGVTGPQVPTLRLVELLPQTNLTTGSSVEYTRELSFTPNAQIVAEGALKPASSLMFENIIGAVKTIATITKVSLQSLADVPSLSQWIDLRLQYAVMLKAEDIFLNAPAPDGLLATAVPLLLAYAPGAGATALDVIAGALGQLAAQGYQPDGVVISGADANALRLLKSSQGEYLWADPGSGGVGVSAMWGVRVVISPSIAPGTFLVGAFQQATLLFPRQQLAVEIAYQNEDDFTHNLACLRAEERCCLAVMVPQGLVTGSLTPLPLTAKK